MRAPLAPMATILKPRTAISVPKRIAECARGFSPAHQKALRQLGLRDDELVRLEGALYINAEFTAPWCIRGELGLAAGGIAGSRDDDRFGD